MFDQKIIEECNDEEIECRVYSILTKIYEAGEKGYFLNIIKQRIKQK